MAPNARVKLARLGYVIYEHPDIGKFRLFASDFGLEETKDLDGNIFFRGYGKDQYVYVARQAPEGSEKRFIGAGFCACSKDDFERACQLEAATIIDASQRPGGGQLVSIRDPNGYEMQVYWGQEEQVIPSDGISACVGEHPTNGAINKQRKGTKYEADSARQEGC